MAKLFSFASWNVEHFKNDRARVRDNAAFIQERAPDVFAIYEVEGKQVFSSFVELMPAHHFFITEDIGGMEILVGVRRDFTAFITQRNGFKSDVPTLRPGALATLSVGDRLFSLLFLHLKSADDARSFGLRADMIEHASNLKRALDRAAGAAANFICLGDLNTMGMTLTDSPHDIAAADEVARFAKRFARRSMRRLSKSHDRTWWNGSGSGAPPADLDHAFASDHLEFTPHGDAGAEILVRGWPERATDEERTAWIRTHSDHALLYGEVAA